MKKILVRGVVALAVLASVGVAAAFAFLPGIVDGRLNAVEQARPYSASETAQRLHESLLVADLHSDSLLWNRDILARNARGHVDLPRLVEGNVAIQAFTVVTKTPKDLNYENNGGDTDNITLLAIMQRWPPATYSSLLERALYQAKRLHDVEQRSNGGLVILKSREDVADFLEKRKSNPGLVAGFLGIEGLHCLEGKLENLQKLYDAGFRMMGITHFFDNELGGSAHGVGKGGLTPFGKDVVAEMERKGILIDLAHASPRLIDDVLEMATRPVMVSHTGVKGTCDRTRNLSDDHIRRVAATGGIIGIGYWDEAVCGTDARAIVDAIEYTAHLAGVDHVALGSDFDGAITAPFDTTRLVEITSELLSRGSDEESIARIMGGNVARLLGETFPGNDTAGPIASLDRDEE